MAQTAGKHALHRFVDEAARRLDLHDRVERDAASQCQLYRAHSLDVQRLEVVALSPTDQAIGLPLAQPLDGFARELR
jgi:hypothetical protein